MKANKLYAVMGVIINIQMYRAKFQRSESADLNSFKNFEKIK